MYDLYFDQYIQCSLWISDTSSTPNPNGVVRAAIYRPGGGEGQSVLDLLELALVGAEAEIEAKLYDIEAALRAAEYGHLQTLRYRPGPGGDLWESRVLGGWIEPGDYERRKAGAQALSVHIRRANRWDATALQDHPTRNVAGKSVDLGLMGLVSNHNDAGHDNWLGDDLTESGVPVTNERKPLVLTLQAADPANACPLTIFAGHRCTWGNQSVAMQIEAEAGDARGAASAVVTASPLNSDGMYLAVSWTGSTEQEIWYGDLANSLSLMGLPYRLLLRLHDVIAEAIWYRWRVYALDAVGEHLVSESEARRMEQGSECIEGPLLDLPPWHVSDASAAQTLRVVLVVRAEATGSHTLKMDFLQLFPSEGWRIYRPLDDQRTLKLVDDGLAGTIANDYGLQSHSAEGPGVDFRWGTLGTNYHFVVLRHEVDGFRRWPVDFQMKVRVQSKPSRRML